MRAQRAREGESQAEMQTAKWTAEGTVNGRPELVGMDFQTCSKARNVFPETLKWPL